MDGMFSRADDEESARDLSSIDTDPRTTLFFIFMCMLVASILGYLLKVWRLTVLHSPIMLIFGLCWGTGALFSDFMMKYTGIAHIPSLILLLIFLPILYFKMIFCIDVHIFFRAGLQIIIISIPVAVLTAVIIGVMETLILDSEGSYALGLALGALCVPTYPLEVVRLLREVGTHTKIISVIMEGEAVVSLGFMVTIAQILIGVSNNVLATWYQIILTTLRLIGGGMVAGLIFGYFSSRLVRVLYSDPSNALIVTVIAPYIATYVSNQILGVDSSICILVLGMFLGIERTSFSVEMDTFLSNFWELLADVMNNILCIIIGIDFVVLLIKDAQTKDIALIIVTYFLVNISRLLAFFCFSCVLSRVGYGLSFQNMLIAVLGGLKNSITLIITLLLLTNHQNESLDTVYMLHLVFLQIFTCLVNACLLPWILKLMGLSQVTMAKKVNMNNCLKHLAYRREKSIAIMKMDRFLSDANWPIVNSATTLRHPYYKRHTDMDQDEANKQDFFLGSRFAVCPDCKTDVPNDPTPKELKEMTREAKLRVLKAKKISYTRQYENGLLSKDGIRVLIQSTDYAMDKDDPTVDLEGLFKLFKKEGTNHCIKRNVLSVFKKDGVTLKPPRRHWRRVCYAIITHIGFTVFIYGTITLNVIPTVMELILSPSSYSTASYVLKAANFTFFLIYVMEFFLKIYGYSYIYIWKHGVKTYFQYEKSQCYGKGKVNKSTNGNGCPQNTVIKSHWNKFDFFLLCLNLVDLSFDILDLVSNNFNKSDSKASTITTVTKLLRLFRFLKIFRFCKACYPRMMKYFNARIDTNMIFAYDIGKAFVTGEEEVLERLSNLVDHEGIREQLRLKMEADRLKVTKLLGLVQKDRPWIAITVKTKQVIKTVLNTMKNGVNELKLSGWVDDVEYSKLMDCLNERYKYERAIKSVQPSPPKVIFQEIPWLAGDKDVTQYLYANVVTRKFDPGDVICAEGVASEGIFIVVTGLVLMTYVPDKDTLSKLTEHGSLPITDYTTNVTFDESVSEYIVSGNCIGELSTITGRSYNCTITSDTYSQAYVLSREVIHKAMEMNSDPIHGLECRLWRSISIRIAMLILMNVPTYQGVNQDQIKYALEKAFVPNLSNYKIFVVNEMMQDIILIEGIIVDFHTSELYTAPCYIPRTVQRLILPKSSTLNVSTTVETKLLIIPVKDVDEYQIMLREEEISQLVSRVSSKCLQHIIQNRASRIKKQKRMGRRVSEYSKKRSSKTAAETSFRSMEQSKSRITYTSENDPEEEMRNINMAVSKSMRSIPSSKK